MIVKALSIQNWNQFQSIKLHFHPRMTFIVGENGSGKTTLLHILNKLLNSDSKGMEEVTHAKDKIGSITLLENKNSSIYHSDYTAPFPAVDIQVSEEETLPKGIFIPAHKCQLSYIKKELEVLTNNLDKQEAFTNALKDIFPKSFGLMTISFQDDSIIFRTESGVIDIESLSSGMTYLFCLSWYIFQMHDLKKGPFLILIDELEAHLHASLQRSLLPKLMYSFPLSQFIVSTHSPHIIHSVKDSDIYTLIINEEYRVISQKVEFVKKAASITTILRDILNVPVTYPIWLVEELTNIKSRYSGKEFTVDIYKELKDDMQKAGLFPIFPQMVQELQEGDDHDFNSKKG